MEPARGALRRGQVRRGQVLPEHRWTLGRFLNICKIQTNHHLINHMRPHQSQNLGRVGYWRPCSTFVCSVNRVDHSNGNSGDFDGDQPDVPMVGEQCYPYDYFEHWSSPLNVTFRGRPVVGI